MAFRTTTHPAYGSGRWKRLRLIKLGQQPMCEICARRGRVVRATVVDHKQSLASGGAWFPHPSKLVSLCHRCHVLKTARVDRYSKQGDATRNAYAGTDRQGNPLDPNDPWNS